MDKNIKNIISNWIKKSCWLYIQIMVPRFTSSQKCSEGNYSNELTNYELMFIWSSSCISKLLTMSPDNQIFIINQCIEPIINWLHGHLFMIWLAGTQSHEYHFFFLPKTFGIGKDSCGCSPWHLSNGFRQMFSHH